MLEATLSDLRSVTASRIRSAGSWAPAHALGLCGGRSCSLRDEARRPRNAPHDAAAVNGSPRRCAVRCVSGAPRARYGARVVIVCSIRIALYAYCPYCAIWYSSVYTSGCRRSVAPLLNRTWIVVVLEYGDGPRSRVENRTCRVSTVVTVSYPDHRVPGE